MDPWTTKPQWFPSSRRWAQLNLFSFILCSVFSWTNGFYCESSTLVLFSSDHHTHHESVVPHCIPVFISHFNSSSYLFVLYSALLLCFIHFCLACFIWVYSGINNLVLTPVGLMFGGFCFVFSPQRSKTRFHVFILTRIVVNLCVSSRYKTLLLSLEEENETPVLASGFLFDMFLFYCTEPTGGQTPGWQFSLWVSLSLQHRFKLTIKL